MMVKSEINLTLGISVFVNESVPESQYKQIFSFYSNFNQLQVADELKLLSCLVIGQNSSSKMKFPFHRPFGRLWYASTLAHSWRFRLANKVVLNNYFLLLLVSSIWNTGRHEQVLWIEINIHVPHDLRFTLMLMMNFKIYFFIKLRLFKCLPIRPKLCCPS